MRLVYDIETNNYLHLFTKIHCIVAKDFDTGILYKFRPHQIDEAVEFLSSADLLIGHNIIDFDNRAIKKMYPNFKPKTVYDTLIAAKLAFPDIKEKDFIRYRSIINKPNTMRTDLERAKMRNIGKHSLEAYGIRLGEYKSDYGKEHGFEEYTEEMLDYCVQDVEVNAKLYEKLLSMELSDAALATEFRTQEICLQQTEYGFTFDYARAELLLANLLVRQQELLDEITSDLGGPFITAIEVVTPKRSTTYKEVLRGSYKAGCPYSKIKITEFNAGSRTHLATRLIERHKWIPSAYGDDGKPTVSEEVLEGIDIPVAKSISEYLMIQKRLGMLSEGKQSWLGLYNPETKAIHGKVNTLGAGTSRATHSNPNLAQLPSVRVPYGKECRQLYTVPHGWKLFGTDAAGLELRMLAHYMFPFDKGVYADIILNGDIHTTNQLAAGLPTRNHAKTFIYALLYGAGAEKIGSIIGGTKKEGTSLKKKFFDNTPAMKQLTDAVKQAAERRGWVKGIDGRRIPVRSAHSALNFLLQGAGAIVCKMWMNEFHRLLKENGYIDGLHYRQSAWVHDELQIAFNPEFITGEIMGKLSDDAIKAVGKELKMNIELASDWSVGDTYADTH